ncbi:hypothetical protein CFI00_0185 [Nocardioides sp. S5]|uniref:hypothetical protein n=1 Tax=Nocardioides sp. S5 TaxID=2017486 RepID=UPI001A8E6B89|nr:hypothetical protein [Nocardioides sp. S5]QSR33397.1 hypothetical protein CFI00_0185 [Nocardioides sp. S5]
MSTTIERHTTVAVGAGSARAAAVRRFVGGFYLVMGGLNAGIVLADAESYRTFADESFSSSVTDAWRQVVMTHPLAWILLLAAGEVVLGLLLLRGGPAARAGWVGVLVFHVLLMSFGFGFWLWSIPVLAVLAPAARADMVALVATAAPVAARRRTPTASGDERPESRAAPGPSTLWSTVTLAGSVLVASVYGLVAESPYRSLPEATVVGARAQDACSIAVAVLLLALVSRRPSSTTLLVRLGLLGYLTYSYLIYVTGVPMNRMFLVYVVIVGLAGYGLVSGLGQVVARPPASRASSALTTGTGWMLVATGVLFAGLWLSVLLPFALGGARPEPQGIGGTPYPVFWLDLAIVLPLVVLVGVLLLRRHRVGPALAVVALIKVVTLFTALWAGPLLSLATGADVHLGPDAGPSLLLLAASTWLVVRWLRSIDPQDLHPLLLEEGHSS